MTDRKACLIAIERHSDRLNRAPNVVGLGVVPDSEPGEFAVAVYVSRKVPERELGPDERIPESLPLAARPEEATEDVEGGNARVPVRVFEIGELSLEGDR